MSEQEQRTIRAMALLEVEEAKQHLALLQAKATQWSKLYAKVGALLSRMVRADAHFRDLAEQARPEAERAAAELQEVLNLNAVLQLDDDIAAAVARLEQAETTRKRLGFS